MNIYVGSQSRPKWADQNFEKQPSQNESLTAQFLLL